MKRTLLTAATASIAILMLAGCSIATDPQSTPETPSSSVSPSAPTDPNAPTGTETPVPMPTEGEVQPPEGADPKLVSFVAVALDSCEASKTQGSVMRSSGVTIIGVPEARAIGKIADITIAEGADGKPMNILPPAAMQSGKPTPFICTISGGAYQALMQSGKSDLLTESNGVWKWNEQYTKAMLSVKDGLVNEIVQIATTEQGKEIEVKFAVTYGVTDAEYKLFQDGVANPTDMSARG